MKIIISAGGRFHAFQLAKQLYQHNSLAKLFTFSATQKDLTIIPAAYIDNNVLCNWIDYLYQKLRLHTIINTTNFNVIKDNLFDTNVSKKIKNIYPFDIFVGWAHYALKSIPFARKKGAKIIIESGSSHIKEQQEILQREYDYLHIPYQPIHPQVIEKIEQEYQLADYIMTLSTNSQRSFIKHGISPQKVLQVPCGADVEFFLEACKQKKIDQKFRVIYVGLLNVRKGIHYLIQAWNSLNLPETQAELILVGCLQQDLKHYLTKQHYKKNIILYGSTNRKNLKTLYNQSSLFVLPSVEDGFGMVMGEAMACGLPVITTTNTGGPDIIQNNIHGYLVPPAQSIILAEKINWCYEHQEACMLMGQAAKQHIQKFTWDNYGNQVYNVYKKILQ